MPHLTLAATVNPQVGLNISCSSEETEAEGSGGWKDQADEELCPWVPSRKGFSPHVQGRLHGWGPYTWFHALLLSS